MSKNKLDYPPISDILIERLSLDFPDCLPRKEVTSYELGFLAGQQSVIDKLKYEAREEDK